MYKKIAFISKYPPMEGGIAAKTYWLTTNLANSGHSIHIITDSENTEEEYRINRKNLDNKNKYFSNCIIHQVSEKIPWHIPDSSLRVTSLLNFCLEIIDKNSIDILDTGYLIPYGIIGYLLNKITGIPYLLRHGGSDIEKFLKQGIFTNLLDKVISNASLIVTDENNFDLFSSKNVNIFIQPPYIPDDKAFIPMNMKKDKPILAIIGKINYYWVHKGLDQILDIIKRMDIDFEFWIVGQGKGLSKFREDADRMGIPNIVWREFVSPWEMPILLNKISSIFLFTRHLPICSFTNPILEALYTGTGLIIDQLEFIEPYKKFCKITENDFIRVDSDNPKKSAKVIKEWLINRSTNLLERVHLYPFSKYIEDQERIYNRLS